MPLAIHWMLVTSSWSTPLQAMMEHYRSSWEQVVKLSPPNSLTLDLHQAKWLGVPGKCQILAGVFVWDSHFQIHNKFPLISGVDSHQHTELFYSILLPEWDPSARYATHERHRCMGFLSFCEGNGTFAPKKSSFIPKNPQGTVSSQSEIAWSQWNRVITMIGSFTDESMSEGLSPYRTLRLETIHDVVRGKSSSEIEKEFGPITGWSTKPKMAMATQL